MLIDCLHDGKKINLSISTHNPRQHQLSIRPGCSRVWLPENVSYFGQVLVHPSFSVSPDSWHNTSHSEGFPKGTVLIE